MNQIPYRRYSFARMTDLADRIIHINPTILGVFATVLFSITILSSPSLAATFTVTKTADTNDGVCNADCSLREAIAGANDNPFDDVIAFNSSVFNTIQTITLGSELSIVNNGTLTINGTGATLLTVSGNNASRIFFVSKGAIATVNQMKITGGNGIGTFPQHSGWAIYSTAATLTIQNCIISANSTTNPKGSGAIYNSAGSLQITNSTVSDNSGISGGAIVNTGVGAVLNVSGSKITGNTADFGAAIYNQAAATVDNTEIRNNTASTSCGGILGGQSLNVTNSRVIANTAASGSGGGLCGPSTGTVVNSVIDWNTAGMSGGGISGGGTVTITASSISNNVSGMKGGGIDTGSGTFSLIRSTVSGNTAADIGGGILATGPLTITNSTISRNTANGPFGGGGIFHELIGGGSLTATHTTISFNRAVLGGGIRNNFGTINLRNTILSDNTASGSGPDFQGTLNSLGFNWIENTSGATITGTTTGNILGVDPLLDPVLRLNGAIVRTHALRPTSPVLDKGSTSSPSVITDQRGFARPFDFPGISNAAGGNASDMGALERRLNDPNRESRADFDGDGKTDISVFRPGDSNWYVYASTAGVRITTFGSATDILAPGDYDGDGKADLGVFRPSTGQWFMFNSSNSTLTSLALGTVGDKPVAGDYDGDGKTDQAIYRPSQGLWAAFRSSDNTTSLAQWGNATDVPVPGDYDADGKTDVGVFRDGNWYVFQSTAGPLIANWGVGTDKPIPADYDGDGKDDLAIYRPSGGLWCVYKSSDNAPLLAAWGNATDVPVPGDYDGDGSDDFAVFRNGDWYAFQSTSGPLIATWGGAGDTPIPAKYIP